MKQRTWGDLPFSRTLSVEALDAELGDHVITRGVGPLARVRSVLFSPASGVWELCAARVDIAPASRPITESDSALHPSWKIRGKYHFLHRLVDVRELHSRAGIARVVCAWHDIPVNEAIVQNGNVIAYLEGSRREEDAYPRMHVRLGVVGAETSVLPADCQYRMVNYKHPYFENFAHAATAWLDLPEQRSNWASNRPAREIHCRISTGVSRFSDVAIDQHGRLTVRITGLPTTGDPPRLKVSVTPAEIAPAGYSFDLRSEEITVPLSKAPDGVVLALVASDDRVLDWIEEDRYRATWGETIFRGLPPVDAALLETLRDLESEWVECKGWVPLSAGKDGEGRSHFQRLCDSIAAFANGRGGTVFIGIDDDGEVTGIADRIAKDPVGEAFDQAVESFLTKLRSRIVNTLAPKNPCSFTPRRIGEKLVLVGVVTPRPRSMRPIHSIDDSHTYLRIGGRNRKVAMDDPRLFAEPVARPSIVLEQMDTMDEV